MPSRDRFSWPGVANIALAAAIGSSVSLVISIALGARREVLLAVTLICLGAGLVASAASITLARDLRQLALQVDDADVVNGTSVRRFWTSPSVRVLAGRIASRWHQSRASLLVTVRASEDCADAAREAFLLGEAILGEAESTAKDAHAAAQAVGAVAEHMNSVAAATEEVDAGVREVARSASEAATLAGRAHIEVQAARVAFDTVAGTSANLASVVETIRQIAKRTHLLALNATIEAAHAGAGAAGFAVVATEVKDLAAQTNSALDSISEDVERAQASADNAHRAIAQIENLVNSVNESQVAIAASVEQQVQATRSIGLSATASADAATGLTANVSSLSMAIRRMAYQGARADTEAGKLEAIQRSLSTAAASVGVRSAPLGEPGGEAVAPPVAYLGEDGLLVIENSVQGRGLNEIEYRGSWQHSLANALVGGTNSYTNMPGDVAILRFRGSGVRAFVVTQHNQGVMGFRLDSGEEEFFNCYSAERRREVLAFHATNLTPGEHELSIRCTGEKSDQSTFFWVSLDRVEVTQK